MNIANLVPGRPYLLFDREADLATVTSRLGRFELHILVGEAELCITTSHPYTWLKPVGHDHLEEFGGLRLGDVVRRGRGKLHWRVTGLALTETGAPIISLVSIPEPARSGRVTVTPQSSTVYGDEIARLAKQEVAA